MFDIKVEDPSNKPGEEKKPPLYVWQNSWGLSTRTLGVMVMIHADDKGLVLPPRVAETQVVIVPVGLTAKTTDEEREKLGAEINGLVAVLEAAGVRVENDQRDGYSPGFKFADWELKGVPLRLEFGPGESAGHFITTARRDIPGKDGKGTIAIPELATAVPKLLETIHRDMYNRANEQFTTHRKVLTSFDEIVPALNDKNLVVVPFCLAEDCEDQIKKDTAKKQEELSQSGPEDVKVCLKLYFVEATRISLLITIKAPSMGAKSLCIPFDQGIGGGEITADTKCINPKCTRAAQKWCMFGRMFPNHFRPFFPESKYLLYPGSY